MRKARGLYQARAALQPVRVDTDRGPGAGADSFAERYYLIDVSLANGHVTPLIRGAAAPDSGAGLDTFIGLASAFDATNSPASRRFDAEGVRVRPDGTFFIPLGARAGVQVASNPASVRWPLIFGGQLYASASSAAFVNVFTVGAGLPQTGVQTNLPLPGMPTTGSASPYAFVLLDLDPAIPGDDTLYVADDRSASSGGGIQKWTLGAAAWTLATTFNVAATPIGFRGLAGVVAAGGGGPATLVATTADAVPRLVVFIDDGGSSVLGTVVATSPANTALRGVAPSPRP